MKMKSNKSTAKVAKLIERILNLFIIRSFIIDALIILVGLFFIIKPYSGIRTCEIIFSIFLLITGFASIFDCAAKKIVKMFNFSLIYGLFSIIIGLLILINPLALANIIAICFGIWMTLTGIVKIINSIYLKRNDEESWSVILAIGILITFIGALLTFNPFVEMYITRVVGIFVVAYAILDITNTILIGNRKKELIKIFK